MSTPRTRSRDSRVEFVYVGDGALCDGSVTGTLEVGHGIYEGVEETTKDVVTPRFRSAQASGQIINNPFSSTKIEHGYQVTGWRVDTNIACTGTALNWQTGTGFYALGADKYTHFADIDANSLKVVKSSLKGVTQTRCLANVIPADVAGLVALGEMKKTLKLISNPLASLTSYIKDIKHSKKYKNSKAPSVGSFVADNWLSYRYGFTPLALEIQGALKAAVAPRRFQRITARSSGRDEAADATKQTVKSDAYFSSTIDSTTTAEVNVRAGILYEHTFTAANRWGVSLHDIPSAAWELVPFSFVVDWFINVGDYLRAITPKAGVNVLASWTTVKVTTEQTANVSSTYVGPATLSPTLKPTGEYSRVTTEVARSPGVQAVFISKFPSIDFDTDKDFIHLADAFALIASSLGHR